ncbi:MAG: DUF3800 domain-containing protein [Planctomycetota bacterium]|nr:DUF3800 domain-containing protein [Planctomycetota bacterium]
MIPWRAGGRGGDGADGGRKPIEHEQDNETGKATIHYFVDEAGDPTLFDAKGRIIVGNEGCSKYFLLGKLDVEDPGALTQGLEELRKALLADPYFKGIPSMQPAAKKTAVMFHAKDDVPEVRREVFKLLLGQKVRFYAAARDKREAAVHESRLREKEPAYRYRPNDMYDALVNRLFRRRWYRADAFRICFSKRGKSDRTVALSEAIQWAIESFERDFGMTNQAEVEITSSTPHGIGGLQAVDYFLWALQRFYEHEHTEKRETECRYAEMIQDLVGEIDDLDFVAEGKCGVLWGKGRPLTLAARTAEGGAKKKPRI